MKNVQTWLFLIIVIMFMLTPINAALLWKDDFTDELFHELIWDTHRTTGTISLENNRCILKIDEKNPEQKEAMVTRSSRSLPPNFDLHAAMEFTNVDGNQGEFYIKIGNQIELIISFGPSRFASMDKKEKKNKQIYLIDSTNHSLYTQTSGNPSLYHHDIDSGERYYITWLCNGEHPALQVIKLGSAPGESNIADFIIETKEPTSGSVEIGVRDGIKEIRLNYIRTYLYGTSSSLVQDWVLF